MLHVSEHHCSRFNSSETQNYSYKDVTYEANKLEDHSIAKCYTLDNVNQLINILYIFYSTG